MNQKQMLAMQQSTVSPCEALWCPGLTSLLASLDSIPSRLLSPPFCSPHDGHQCSLPCTPMWSVLHPSVLISQQHLTLRTIPSFSCPWLLGCWILLVFCLFFFFFCLLGSAFLDSLDGPWIFIPADILIFDPYMMEFSRKGLAVRSLFTFVFLPSVSILPSCWWSQVYFPSPDSFPECQTYICHQQHHASNATQKLNLQVQNTTLDFHAPNLLTPSLPREWSL